MATERILLLAAVWLAGTNYCECVVGEINQLISDSNKETFPWEVNKPGEKPVWNPDVTLKGCWKNVLEDFKLTCSIKNGEYRAILYYKSESIKTMIVRSCNENLLESVKVLRWWDGGLSFRCNSREILYYTHGQACTQDTLKLGQQFTPTNSKCSFLAEWMPGTNSRPYKNGWKSEVIPQNPEQC